MYFIQWLAVSFISYLKILFPYVIHFHRTTAILYTILLQSDLPLCNISATRPSIHVGPGYPRLWVRIWLAPTSKVLHHTCFIGGQGCKWRSRRPKPTLSVISDVEHIIYIYLFTFYIYNLAVYSFINQSNFYSANIPGKARLSGATAESVFNCKIEETVP